MKSNFILTKQNAHVFVHRFHKMIRRLNKIGMQGIYPKACSSYLISMKEVDEFGEFEWPIIKQTKEEIILIGQYVLHIHSNMVQLEYDHGSMHFFNFGQKFFFAPDRITFKYNHPAFKQHELNNEIIYVIKGTQSETRYERIRRESKEDQQHEAISRKLIHDMNDGFDDIDDILNSALFKNKL